MMGLLAARDSLIADIKRVPSWKAGEARRYLNSISWARCSHDEVRALRKISAALAWRARFDPTRNSTPRKAKP